MIPLVKNDQGEIRPIAVGELFYRLCSRVVVRSVDYSLLPFQFGVGTPGGVEPIIHLANLKKHNRSIVSVDLKNAFNTMRRDYIREAVVKRSPGLLRAFIWSYGHHAMYFTHSGLEGCSRSGVRQGDPMGPLLFSLGYSQLLSQLSKKMEVNGFQDDFQCVAYLDDTYFFPKEDHSERLLKLVEATFRDLSFESGLKLKPEKTRIASPSDTRPSGTRMLGTQVGGDYKKFVQDEVQKIQPLLTKLKLLRK